MMPRHGVIFDLDDTLADTLPDITEAVNEVLRWAGLPTHDAGDYRRWVGHGMRQLLARAIAATGAELTDAMIDRARANYRRMQLNQTRLYDGIPELLDALDRRNVPMAVLTNKPHELAAAMVEALCGSGRFVAVAGDRFDGRQKPDPAEALRLAEAMDLVPADVVLLGDSDVDIRTARNAGMVSVAATWGSRDREALTPLRPDHLIDRPAELLALPELGDGPSGTA